jgi:hypothetical protein
MMFYRKSNGSLTLEEHEAQFAPHEVISDEMSMCPVCGLTWRHDIDDPCLCKDVVDFDGEVDYDAKEVFDLLQPLIDGAYRLGLNPLPALRKLFGERVKLSYWNSDCFGALRDCPMSDVISGAVTVLVSKDGWCRFW